MKHGKQNEHPSAERLQALLEGGLSRRERSRVEEHLAVCARCSAEHEAWRVLFEDLGELRAHRPHEGFAERVMASVHVPARLPLAARVRTALTGIGTAPSGHLDPATLQDFLEGGFVGRKATAVEKHLADCRGCATEAEAWYALLGRLDALERLAPSERFAERVMGAVTVPEALAPSLGERLAARVRATLAAVHPPSTDEHLASEKLQDLVDGALPSRALGRARTHLAGCASCSTEAEAWRTLAAGLGGLEPLSPRAGFAERVMAEVRVPQPAPATASRPLRLPALGRALRLVPRTRRAWAALSGMAVTPAVTLALVAYTVFSHPTLTLDGLASFVWWQLSDLASLAWTTVAAAAVDSAEIFGLYSLVGAVTSAPLAIAGGVLAYGLVCTLALRVLYKNLMSNRPVEGRYVHAPAP